MLMFDTAALIRCEADILSIILLCYIRIQNNNSYGRQAKSIAFGRLVIALMAELVFDMAIWLVDGIPDSTVFRYANIVFNILYMVNSGVVTYFLYYYVCSEISITSEQNRTINILIKLPLLVLAVFSLSSIWTGAIFEIDESNIYHDGSLMFIQVVVAYGYLFIAVCKVLYHRRLEVQKYRRQELSALLLFFVFPAIGGILELSFETLPLTWPVLALALAIIFIKLQGYQISIDELTGLNNRRRFDYYLSAAVDDLSGDDCVLLLLGDVNSFKTINDKFGHVEGDKALKCVSDTLKGVLRHHNTFIARYGGDEFAVVIRRGTYSDAEQVKHEIQKEFSRQNETTNRIYKLTLSIGIGQCSADNKKTIKQLIQEADDNLYKEKEQMKIKV